VASYYYFGTTLTSLSFRGTAPASYASFLERSAVHLSKRDQAALVGASLAVPADGKDPEAARASRLLRNYYRWERALRNELARLRAGRLGTPAEKHLRPGDVEWDALRAAQAAFQAESPLDGELAIERERWTLLDRLLAGHYFDLEALLAYGLKLQALERMARFETERGRGAYGTVYRDILGGADSGAPPSDDTGDTL